MSDAAERETEEEEIGYEVEEEFDVAEFVATLRRVADALEAGEPFEIEYAGKTISVPLNARYSIEHEFEDGEAELEFQIAWNTDEDEDEEEESAGA